MSAANKQHAREAVELAERIRPLLSGRSPQVQGAALVLLTDIWLDGHRMPGDPEGEHSMRMALLAEHFFAAALMVKASEAPASDA